MERETGIEPASGESQFNNLLFRRAEPVFCAFDVLHLNGRDLRRLPLIERKRILRGMIPRECLDVLFVDHVEIEGERLFDVVCARGSRRNRVQAPAQHLRSRERHGQFFVHWGQQDQRSP